MSTPNLDTIGVATYSSKLIALPIAKRKYNPEDDPGYDSVSSVSADSETDYDTDSNSNFNSDFKGEQQRRTMPKIRLLVQQIVGEISSLYDLSSLLRRPKVTDKYIRSVNSKSDSVSLENPDTLPLNVGFSSFDENHVVEKVIQWRGLTKAERSVEFNEEDVAPIEGVGHLELCDVQDISWLCQRLGTANTRRREQFQYWASHPYDSERNSPRHVELPLRNVLETPVEPVEEVRESRSQASTLKPTGVVNMSSGPKTIVSRQSFSTVAISAVQETNTIARARTVYAPTDIGKGRSNSVPNPPKPKDGSGTFPCPYCGATLDHGEMSNRQSWQ